MRRSLVSMALPMAVATFILFGPGAGGAQAADYYVSPEATNTTAPCDRPNPCRLNSALTAATLGEQILLEPGDYFDSASTPWANLPDVGNGVVLRAVDPASRPVIHGEINLIADAFLDLQSGATIRDIELRLTAKPTVTISYGVGMRAGSLIDRSVIRVQGNGTTSLTACTGAGGMVRNSACLGEGPGNIIGVGIASVSANYLTTLVNVTAVSTATTGYGARVSISSAHTSTLNITNSIMRGPTGDLGTGTFTGMPPTGTAVANVAYSNWDTYTATGNGTNTLNQGVGNQTGATAAAPLFRDAPAGDFRPAEGSPTIDVGIPSPDLLAPGGVTRTLGQAPDLGGFEFAPRPDFKLSTPAQVTRTSAVLNGLVDPHGSPTTSSFTIGRPGTVPIDVPLGTLSGQAGLSPVSASVDGLEPGTTYEIRGRSDSAEAGTFLSPPVRITTTGKPAAAPPLIRRFRIVAGKGRKKPSTFILRTANATNVRLRFDRIRGKRLSRVGAFRTKVRDGLNRLPFKGKVGKKRLNRGRYRVTAVAFSRDGTRSKPRRASFRFSPR